MLTMDFAHFCRELNFDQTEGRKYLNLLEFKLDDNQNPIIIFNDKKPLKMILEIEISHSSTPRR
jgi:hypothetical protein